MVNIMIPCRLFRHPYCYFTHLLPRFLKTPFPAFFISPSYHLYPGMLLYFKVRNIEWKLTHEKAACAIPTVKGYDAVSKWIFMALSCTL